MKKVLVVDDEENIRLLYKEELEDEGYEVCVAATVEEAIKLMDDEHPDLVMLDIKLPGMDGLEYLTQLKKKNDETPVILCSAYGQYKQDFRVWASDAYVVKSADLRELKLTVKKILNP